MVSHTCLVNALPLCYNSVLKVNFDTVIFKCVLKIDLRKDEPLYRVEALCALCLCEHPSRMLSAFGVEVPCQKLQLSMLAVWPTSSSLFSDFSAWMQIRVS